MLKICFKAFIFSCLMASCALANCRVSIEDIIFYGECRGELKHGEFISKYDNGTVQWRVNYKLDNLDGKFYQYFPSGKLHMSGKYKDQKIHGKYIQYEVDGSKLVAKFKHGLLNGNLYKYDKDNKKLKELKYYYGKLVNQKYYY